MKVVYVVIDHQIEADPTKAVFSTRQKAKEYIKKNRATMDSPRIYEFKVDEE